jgi:predicted TPR repeat methyltransferase
MEARNFSAPSILADEVAKCFPVTRDKIKIMDIACGTGLVGEKVNSSFNFIQKNTFTF